MLSLAFWLLIVETDEKTFGMNNKSCANKPQDMPVVSTDVQIWESLNEAQKNNLKTIDLTDLETNLPLHVIYTKRVLQRTESWEHSTWDRKNDHDTLGYPTVVKNIYGTKPDNKYYLYYAHHDPKSGIGCAVADSIEGPYRKLAEIDPTKANSVVLVPPGKAGEPFHYSSPSVVWNEGEHLWFMYFHFFRDEWKKGKGHQKTALATSPDLRANIWTPWTDRDGHLVAVLPTTTERWMNSQSSYHAIQRLPNGTWLAFLRGTGGEYDTKGNWVQDPTKLGFATSTDGRHWAYFPENPIIYQVNGSEGRKGVYRPHFIGYLGNGRYVAVWSESNYYDSNPRIIYGTTSDFKTFKRDPRGYANWPSADGLINPWREGNKLYLFAGKYIYVMELPAMTTGRQ